MTFEQITSLGNDKIELLSDGSYLIKDLRLLSPFYNNFQNSLGQVLEGSQAFFVPYLKFTKMNDAWDYVKTYGTSKIGEPKDSCYVIIAKDYKQVVVLSNLVEVFNKASGFSADDDSPQFTFYRLLK